MEPLAIKPDEVLEELCYFSMNIAKLDINPDGGNFTLGSGDVCLEVPSGPLKKETSIRYGIILHGPFVLPAWTKSGLVAFV